MSAIEIIEAAAGGNTAAKLFLDTWASFCHLVDDLMDKDRERTNDEILRGILSMLLQVSSNPFYAQHRQQFEALFCAAARGWLDSERWSKSDDAATQAQARVLAGLWHEVIYQTALLTSGWEASTALTAASREYR